MAVAARRAEDVQMRTRVRKRGHPSEQISFRCPSELVRAIEDAGSDKTEGATRLLDRAVDARNELGEFWTDVEIRAYREQITEGEALGRIAREALERDRKGRGR
jgi:hypothetical protein